MERGKMKIVYDIFAALITLPLAVVHELIHVFAALLLGIKITGFSYGTEPIEIPESKFFVVNYPWEKGYEFGANIQISVEEEPKNTVHEVCKVVIVVLAPTILFLFVLSVLGYLLYIDKPLLSLLEILLLAVITFFAGEEDFKFLFKLMV